MITQTHPDQLDQPIPGQKHEPLAFLSETLTKTQLRWGVIEKESFTIIETIIFCSSQMYSHSSPIIATWSMCLIHCIPWTNNANR